MIFNTHSHLNDSAFDNDRENVIKETLELGVSNILVIGWDKESSINAIKLAEQYDFIYAAVGYHPENLEGITNKDFEDVMKLLNHPKVVAVGEIGLDYYWDKREETKAIQKKYFIKQIEEANKRGLPIVIHSRDAIFDTLNILKEHPVNKGGIMHCYSGSAENVKDFIKCNMYISLGGTVTYKNAVNLKEVAKIVPLERLLVETDDPYLTPVPFRGKRNIPGYAKYVVEEIAKLKELPVKEVEKQTYENAKRLFGI